MITPNSIVAKALNAVDLKKYVPARLIPHFEEAYKDSDGYWFMFDDGVENTRTGGGSTVHEDTIRDAVDTMRSMRIVNSITACNAEGGNIVGTRWVAKDDPLFIVRVLSESAGKVRIQSADGGTCTYSADEFKREYRLANAVRNAEFKPGEVVSYRSANGMTWTGIVKSDVNGWCKPGEILVLRTGDTKPHVIPKRAVIPNSRANSCFANMMGLGAQITYSVKLADRLRKLTGDNIKDKSVKAQIKSIIQEIRSKGAEAWRHSDGSIEVSDRKPIGAMPLEISVNSAPVRSRNAVVQKALNTVARNGRDSAGILTVGTKVKFPKGETGEIVKVKKIYSHGFVEPEYTVMGSDGRTFIENEGRFEVVNTDTGVLRETAVNATERMLPVYSSDGKAFMKKAEAAYEKAKDSDLQSLWVRLSGELDRMEAIPDDEKDDIEENLHFLAGMVVKRSFPYRSTNSVVAKALNARAVCNETIEGVFKGLDSGKYDSVAVAPRDNGFPEVRRYGGGVGFSYGDEDELRAMIKSGKYVELLFYKNHSLKGRIPLNASRVARNARQVEMPKIPQGAKGRRDLEKVVKRINEAYKMDGARQSIELTSIKNELVWDTAYYTSGLSGADKAEMMKAIRFLMSKCKVKAVKPKGFTTSEMYD